jgi:hypothetical protein
LIAAALTGCADRPPPIISPELDPETVAERAIADYDADGDGALGKSDLEKVPAVKAAFTEVDLDADGTITKEEIVTRLERWTRGGSRVGSFSFTCEVYFRGLPAQGATVTFEPLPCMGEEFTPATGTTDNVGATRPALAVEHRPEPDLEILWSGLYQVRISKVQNGREMIPAKYNTQTTLGQEVGPGTRSMRTGGVRYMLTP